MMAEERERGTEIPLLLVGVMVTTMKMMKGCSLLTCYRSSLVSPHLLFFM
ncbi:hypothetical protein Peur_051486 [Populus x canadensis]